MVDYDSNYGRVKSQHHAALVSSAKRKRNWNLIKQTLDLRYAAVATQHALVEAGFLEHASAAVEALRVLISEIEEINR